MQIDVQSLSPDVRVDQSVPVLAGPLLYETADADSNPELHVQRCDGSC